MKSLELKNLPVFSIIYSKENYFYIRNDKYYWEELSAHCVECCKRVFDDPKDRGPEAYQVGEEQIVQESAAEYFGEWSLRAIGVEVGA